MKIKSTKFLTNIFCGLCVTVVEIILIYKDINDYTQYYFMFMAALAGIYTWSKHNQNITLAHINGNEVNDGTERIDGQRTGGRPGRTTDADNGESAGTND